MLTSEERTFYEDNGFLFPVPVFSAAEVARFRSLFDEYTSEHRAELATLIPRKRRAIYSLTHLELPWVHETVSHERVLNAVSSVIGPDVLVLVWESTWFVKYPHDESFISWHQDGPYWGLTPPNVTTAWNALAPSVEANGCMRVVAGSHRSTLPHRDTYAENNALVRGQDRYGHFEIVQPPSRERSSSGVRAEAERRLLTNVLPKN